VDEAAIKPKGDASDSPASKSNSTKAKRVSPPGERPTTTIDADRDPVNTDDGDTGTGSAKPSVSLLELLASDPSEETGAEPKPTSSTAERDGESKPEKLRMLDLGDSESPSGKESSSWLPPESLGRDTSAARVRREPQRFIEVPIAVAMVTLIVGASTVLLIASRFAPSDNEILSGSPPVSMVENQRYLASFESGALGGDDASEDSEPPSGPRVEGRSIGAKTGDESQDSVEKSPSESTTTVSSEETPIDRNESVLCNSNYSGCVPDVSDVDCEGDGDGPAFLSEPVVVLGTDVYSLDTDDDRAACEQDQPASGG